MPGVRVSAAERVDVTVPDAYPLNTDEEIKARNSAKFGSHTEKMRNISKTARR